MHSQMKNYQHQTQRFFKKNNCFQLTIPIQNKNIASVAVERNSDVVKTNQKSQPSAFITAMMTNYQIAIENQGIGNFIIWKHLRVERPRSSHGRESKRRMMQKA
jgi:hypothetical protein